VISRLLLLSALLFSSIPALRADTLAEKDLRDAVAREKEIFARVQGEGETLDRARFQADLQSLVSTYDVLIQKNPDYAPAYIAYGVLLSRVGMAKAAAAILMKANKLDPNVPLVKNQMAMLLAEDGRPIEALPWLMAAIDLAPNEPLYHYHMGKLLNDARDDFLKAGEWTRAALDRSMLAAFRKAAELSPDVWVYTYRYAEAFYDLETPQWDEALKQWSALEAKAKPGVEQDTVRLHAANVLIKKGDPERARLLLAMVTSESLLKQKQTLLDQMAAKPEK